MGILRFRLLGFPVQVQPGFWLLVLLLGMWGGMTSVGRFVSWAVVVLVGVWGWVGSRLRLENGRRVSHVLQMLVVLPGILIAALLYAWLMNQSAR